jgi:hypothetical protein
MNTIIIAAAGVPLSNVIGARPAVKPFLVTGVILLIIGIIGVARIIMLSGLGRQLEVVCAVLMNIGGGVGIFLLIVALINGLARPDISTRSLEHEYGISIVKVAGAGYADTISSKPSHDTGTAIVFKRGGEQVNGVIVVDDSRVTVFAMTGSHGDLKELKPVAGR